MKGEVAAVKGEVAGESARWQGSGESGGEGEASPAATSGGAERFSFFFLFFCFLTERHAGEKKGGHGFKPVFEPYEILTVWVEIKISLLLGYLY